MNESDLPDLPDLTVRIVTNGYIVERDHAEIIHEELDSCSDGCSSHALLSTLYTILEELGGSGSKHDKCRVQIRCKCEEDKVSA